MARKTDPREKARFAQIQAAAVERTEMREHAIEAFNTVAAHHRANGDLNRAAEAEIAREFMTNPVFREWLKNRLWEQWSAKNVGKFA